MQEGREVKNFATALAGLGVMLNQRVSPEMLEGYCVVLGEYPEEQLISCCTIFAKTNRFLPKPVEFIDLIERGEMPNTDVKSQAMASWSQLQPVWSNSTAVEQLCRQDVRTRAGVNSLGGWFSMVNSGDASSFQRTAFVQAFVGENQNQQRLAIESRLDENYFKIAEKRINENL
jgi:hypothetical protein